MFDRAQLVWRMCFQSSRRLTGDSVTMQPRAIDRYTKQAREPAFAMPKADYGDGMIPSCYNLGSKRA